MTCSHASAPLSAHTLAWRRKHDDFFATGFLIRSLQAAFAQLASGRVGSTTRPRAARFFLRENTIRATVLFDRFGPAPIFRITKELPSTGSCTADNTRGDLRSSAISLIGRGSGFEKSLFSASKYRHV